MNQKRWILLGILLSLLSVSVPLFSQVTFLPGDPEVAELEELYHSAGRVLPVTAYPMTRHDLYELAEKLAHRLSEKLEESAEVESGNSDDSLVDEDQVDEDEKVLNKTRLLLAEIQGYMEGLDYRVDEHRIGFTPALNFELYLRSDNKWQDFHRLWLNTRPLIDLDMWYALDNRAALTIRAPLRKEYEPFAVSNLIVPQPEDPFNIENHFVYKGYFWYNFDPLRVTLGRHPVHFGPLKNSLMPSDRLPFMDMFRAQLPLGPITMDLFISTLENRKARGDVSLPVGSVYDFKKNLIFYAVHRFEIDFSILRLGIAGQEVYIREENAFVLGDFFPVFSWHQSDLVPNNLCLIADIDIVLFKELHLLAQYGLDDFASTSIGIADSAIPSIDAWIIGAEYATALFGGRFSAYAETGYTHYLWGNFNNELALGRSIYRLAMVTGFQALPLTSPFGPGTNWVYAEAALKEFYTFDFLLFFQFLSKNTLANLTSTSYEESAVVANAPRDSIFTIGGKVEFSGIPFLSVFAEPSLFLMNGDPWLEFTLGAAASYALKGKL